MRFEDILPCIRAGRLVRRATWKEGVCVGASNYEMRSGAASHISRFWRPDRESGGGTWHDLQMGADLIADDWELVPEIPIDKRPGIHPSVLATLSELAVRWGKGTQETYPKEWFSKNLSMLAHEATEAYKTEDPERLWGAMLHGLAALTMLRIDEEMKADAERRRR